jgi:hypothetical protein
MWEIYEFVNKVYYHFVGWRNDQNKSFRPWRVVQLCCWWLFQLESFAILKSCLKLSFSEIENLSCSNKVRWSNDQNKSCRSRWVLQIYGLWLFIWSHLLSKKSIIVLIFWNNIYKKLYWPALFSSALYPLPGPVWPTRLCSSLGRLIRLDDSYHTLSRSKPGRLGFQNPSLPRASSTSPIPHVVAAAAALGEPHSHVGRTGL